MSNLHPVFQAALRSFSPPEVTRESRSVGSGGVVTFRGADREAVYRAALDEKNSIDMYRSPAVKHMREEDGGWAVDVRYYGLD